MASGEGDLTETRINSPESESVTRRKQALNQIYGLKLTSGSKLAQLAPIGPQFRQRQSEMQGRISQLSLCERTPDQKDISLAPPV